MTAVWIVVTVAALCYSALLVEAILGFPLDPARSYQSELGAAGEASRPLFAASEIVGGAACLILAVAFMVRARKARPTLSPARAAQATTRWAFVALGGACIVDALIPMRCAESSSATCRQMIRTGGMQIKLEDALHVTTSVTAVIACWVVCVTLPILTSYPVARALASAWEQPRGGKAVRRWLGHAWEATRQYVAVSWRSGGAGRAALVVALSYCVMTLVLLALILVAGQGGQLPSGTGWVQRAQSTVGALAIILATVAILRRRPATGVARS